jgi:hypothetical protein
MGRLNKVESKKRECAAWNLVLRIRRRAAPHPMRRIIADERNRAELGPTSAQSKNFHMPMPME